MTSCSLPETPGAAKSSGATGTGPVGAESAGNPATAGGGYAAALAEPVWRGVLLSLALALALALAGGAAQDVVADAEVDDAAQDVVVDSEVSGAGGAAQNVEYGGVDAERVEDESPDAAQGADPEGASAEDEAAAEDAVADAVANTVADAEDEGNETEAAGIAEDPDAAALAAALAALENQDFRGAREIFQSLAEQDNAAAQHQLGRLHHRGLGVEIDAGEAAHWYARAAQQGHTEAQYRLGNLYLMGEGVGQSDEDAAHWLEQAAAQGHDGARRNLDNIQRITRSREKLAREMAGRTPPQEELPAADETAAAAPTESAARRGFWGRLWGQDDPQAPASDDPDDEMPTPLADAAAAEPGEAPVGAAAANTADKPRKGFFARLFGGGDKESAANDDETAQPGAASQVDVALDTVSGDSDTSIPAGDLTLNPMEQSGAVSNYELGLAYARGDGVKQDHSQAMEHFSRAAKQGYAPAQYRLGLAYAQGDGVKQDHARALTHFTEAAEQGYAPAQHRLGLAHARGQGTEQDLAVAIGWYEKAALQGDAIAQRSLARAYLAGAAGVDRNETLALAWYELLAEGGNRLDVHRRDALLEVMSEEEVQAAQALKTDLQSRLSTS